jgi:hypothetical protein
MAPEIPPLLLLLLLPLLLLMPLPLLLRQLPLSPPVGQQQGLV